MDRFSSEVIKALKHYVYRLIDPRNGNTFYVGRGQGNRVFAHVQATLKLREDEDDDSTKMKLIRRLNDVHRLRPIHVIHRHGLGRKEAVEVEAALIDCYPGLTNEVTGEGSFERGSATVQQIETQYAAPIMKPVEGDKLLYIKTKAAHVEAVGLYEAVRGNWIIPTKAEEADYVIAVVDQMCRGVFVADGWKPAPNRPERYYFHGRKAPAEIVERYVDKRIPWEYRKPGLQRPVIPGWK